MKLDIVIVTYNSENTIDKFYNNLKESLSKIKYNLLFINNASTDNTIDKLSKLYKNDDDKIKIISLAKKETDDVCFFEGLKYAKGDLVAVMNLNDDIKCIIKMYDFLLENKEYDSVFICNKNIKNNAFRNNKIKFVKKMTNITHIDEITNLKMFRSNMVPYIIKISEEKSYSNAIYSFLGFNIYYDYSYTKVPKKDDLNNFLFNYNKYPFKIIKSFGIFITLISIFYLIYIIMFSFNKLTFLTFMVSFLGGLNITFLGIIGEYLFKVFKRNYSLPKFIIKEKIGFDENYL